MVDQLLGGLFGGADDEDDNRRQTRARDFVSRYEQGPPHQGYDDDEVVHNYRAMDQRMSPQDFEEAATESFGRMSQDDRKQYRQMMRDRTGGRFEPGSEDPRELARTTSRYRQEESGGLLSMFGMGGGDDGRRGDLVSGSSGGGGMLDSPVAKAALAGIGAIAMKKMMSR